MKQALKTFFRKTKYIVSESMRQKLWDALLICSFLALIMTSVIVLRWDSILFVILLLLNLFIFASYRYGFSIPGIAPLSQKYVRKNVQEFSKINARYFKIKIVYYLVLLAHDIDAAFGLLFHNPDFYILEERINNKGKSQYFVLGKRRTLEESMSYLRAKKKKATMISLSSSAGVTLAIIIGALILSPQTRAATYQWVQSSWSGGADTSAIAGHPSNLTGWTKYFSKDGTISAGSDGITGNTTTTNSIDTTNSDFSLASSSNMYITNDSVTLLKQEGGSCSTSTECANNLCKSGVCTLVGESYQGGKIAYIFKEGDSGYVAGETHGLIAATADVATGEYGIRWYKGSYVLTGANGSSIGTGLSNTNKIISVQGSVATTYAAGVARAYTGGGYTDWYLPSLYELQKLWLGRDLIGGFNRYMAYWSSTEQDFEKAYDILWNTGGIRNDTKDVNAQIRPIRSF